MTSKELRERLSFAQILQDYGVELKLKGENQHMGFCPLPCHTGSGKKSPSFSASLSPDRFHCFGCKASGNLIDFVILMNGDDKNDKTAFARACNQLRETYLGQGSQSSGNTRKGPQKPPEKDTEPSLPQVINEPLSLELKLDSKHPYLSERGFSQETVQLFGAGYCSRGIMKERIALPLHNQEGERIGYVGRLVDDSQIGEKPPKYRFPSKRQKDGKEYVLKKSEFLYGGHLVTAPVMHLVIVEGFFDVWRLHEAEITAVSIMGTAMSEKQEALITALTHPKGCVWIILDGDDQGRKAASEIAARLTRARYTRVIDLDEGSDPAALSLVDLKSLF